ncbi:allantoate amidohydrolase [Methylobacterium sp. Leaf93]|uniref:allantoate amidohydrolase n=1 Tax=Methylobacterium sp. Leaf93 TaxID=1736249 RepID=UPI0006F30F66|nr:allantoate amidohydrolase [Methylobacterium sp. Leaf93]KQP13957.1 Zn-dependent hydrolase [Methylobacterium sp. Leaf93]
MTSISSVPDAAAIARAFHALFAEISACGATPGGGITRLCASAEDGQARRLFANSARETGAEILLDAVGNQFAVFPLTDGPGAPLVMMGSHLDSQPKAGRFDGTYGVVAAAAIGAALMRARRASETFGADFCAVNWTGEEGARFRPSLLGSGTYAGARRIEEASSSRDDAGITLREALDGIGFLGTDRPPPLPACYLELHVEQGLVLEKAKAHIGIVTRNWGAAKIDVVFTGEQAHTGPTPMPRRRDALLAAAYLIAEVREIAERWPGRFHSSVGRILVEPNSPNVVPARVELSVELRSADNALLTDASLMAEAAITDAAERAGVVAAIPGRTLRPIRLLPEAVCDLVAACAEEASLRSLRMDTVAGHDAISLLGQCPTGIVFVPSVDGIAHNEAELTRPADLEAGLAVALRAAWRLCRAGGSPERALLFRRPNDAFGGER